MTTASRERTRLDKFLHIYGSGTGTLVRTVGTGANQASYSVDVRIHIRNFTPDELNSEIIQGDSHVIMSSTEIILAQWPGAQTTPPIPGNDIRVPRRGDKLQWQGRPRNVEQAEGFYFTGELVRIEMQVRGQQ